MAKCPPLLDEGGFGDGGGSVVSKTGGFDRRIGEMGATVAAVVA